MKSKLLLLILLMSVIASQAQYFSRDFNYSYTTPVNERFNAGIRTSSNYAASLYTNYYYAGVGTATNTLGTTPPFNGDRLRFVSVSRSGATVYANKGYEFRNYPGSSTKYYNNRGYSIAEYNNSLGTGGYVIAGSVVSNPATAATAPGGSDILFASVQNNGTIDTAIRVDINNGFDEADCIRPSSYIAGTFLACGFTNISSTQTDCWVARITNTGYVIWLYTYNFDMTPGATAPTAYAFANSLCEQITGAIYVVGTFQDDGSTNKDALCFGLSPYGGVLWANTHDLSTNDNWLSVQNTSDGNIIIGGYTNFNGSGLAPVANYSWLTKYNPALPSAPVLWSKEYLMPTGSPTIPYGENRCYEAVERLSVAGFREYYLFGPFASTPATFSLSVLKTNDAGIPFPSGRQIYEPTQLLYVDGFGIDFATSASSKPGLCLFASHTNTSGGISSLLRKTYFNLASCTDICTAMLTQYVDLSLPTLQRNHQDQQTWNVYGLKWKTYGFSSSLLCSQTTLSCGSNARTAGTEEEELAQEGILNIFPNPVQDQTEMTINVYQEGTYKLSLFDISGNLLTSEEISLESGENTLTLALGEYASGVYLISVRSEETNWVQKIVKY